MTDPMNDLRQASADVSGVELVDHFADANKMVPTQRQLLQLAAEFWPEGCEPTQATSYARAVLARYGSTPPRPVPVAERLPGPKDCDAEGRCWIGCPEYAFPLGDTGDYDHMDPEWRLEEPPLPLVSATSRAVWLPAHALPQPS